MQSGANFAFPPQTTASSGLVASKPSSKVVGPTQKKNPSGASKNPGLEDLAVETNTKGFGGISEEDDSLEKKAAMSSPMKGGELRSTTKVWTFYAAGCCLTLFKSLLKFKGEQSEIKLRKQATFQDLPKGANEDAAWTRLVIPNFINLILAGKQPWIITDDAIIAELQRVWDHIYGMKVEFTIEKGTVPFELVSLNISTVYLLIPF